jgi:hypothetical protein
MVQAASAFWNDTAVSRAIRLCEPELDELFQALVASVAAQSFDDVPIQGRRVLGHW